MVVGSVERLTSPQSIHYQESIVVAAADLLVNIVCACILGRAPEYAGRHDHDLNIKSAHLHVVADAATSVLATVALAGGWLYGWSRLDPVMGIVGAALVAVWAKNLLGETGKVLLDREMYQPPLCMRFGKWLKAEPKLAKCALPACKYGRSASNPMPVPAAS